MMEKTLLDFVTEKTHALIAAPTCCAELKAVAQDWLKDPSEEMTKKYVAEVEADIMPVDNLLAFAESEMGAKVFGAEAAKGVAAHAREIKAAGARYCDCPACVACAAILEKKAELLG